MSCKPFRVVHALEIAGPQEAVDAIIRKMLRGTGRVGAVLVTGAVIDGNVATVEAALNAVRTQPPQDAAEE